MKQILYQLAVRFKWLLKNMQTTRINKSLYLYYYIYKYYTYITILFVFGHMMKT